PERLVLDLNVTDAHGRVLFLAFTEVDFTEVPGGTRMDVSQTYTPMSPQAAGMTAGASEGWSQTLHRMEAEIKRAKAGQPTRSVVHAVFHLERTYDATPERVYRALSDQAAKDKWFARAPGMTRLERSMDFRVGGHERAVGRWENGMVSSFE